MPTDNLAFFVGSGCSVPCGGPTWERLIFNLLIYACKRWSSLQEQLNSDYRRYRSADHLQLAQCLKDGIGPGSFVKALQASIRNKDFNYNIDSFRNYEPTILEETLRRQDAHSPGDDSSLKYGRLHESLARIKPRWIFTTNYDSCVEDAFAAGRYAHRVFVPSKTEPKDFELDAGTRIVKLHGSLGDDTDPANYIFGDRDYSTHRKNPCREELINVLKSADIKVIWLGFGFQDLSVMKDFLEVIHAGKSGGRAILAEEAYDFHTVARALRHNYEIEVEEVATFDGLADFVGAMSPLGANDAPGFPHTSQPRQTPSDIVTTGETNGAAAANPHLTPGKIFDAVVREESVRFCCKSILLSIRTTLAYGIPRVSDTGSISGDGYDFFKDSFTRYLTSRSPKVESYLGEIGKAFDKFATGLGANDLLGIGENGFAEKFRSYLDRQP